MGNQVVPVEETERVEQRRELVVAALARSIRATAEGKRRSLRGRVVLGLGLAASVALGLGIAAHVRQRAVTLDASATTVADVRGDVVVSEGGETRVLARGGQLALRAVGEIQTAVEGQAEIHSQKSLVRLGPATKLTVPLSTPVEERYRLALGTVEVSVDKNSHITRSVVVETPNAEVVVHGTVFAVSVVSRANRIVTDVSVTHGSVWVLANGVQVALLATGQRWSSDAEPASAPPEAKAELLPEPTDAASPHDAPVRAPRPATPAERKASTLAEQSRQFQEAIDARNRGDDGRAAELFARLVARYPGYEEAQVQLFRAESRLGRSASAAAEARRYLAQHPRGFAQEEARLLALRPAAAPPH